MPPFQGGGRGFKSRPGYQVQIDPSVKFRHAEADSDKGTVGHFLSIFNRTHREVLSKNIPKLYTTACDTMKQATTKCRVDSHQSMV